MIVLRPEAEKRLGKKLKGKKTEYYLLSTLGTRNLGGPYSLKEAEGRERQVQYFKHKRNPSDNAAGEALKNPLRKIAEIHPDDRAIIGSAVGSAVGYMIMPAAAPLGAAAGHIAGKRLSMPQGNPLFGKKEPKKRPPKRKRHRSLRNISLDIKRSWREPWRSGPENRAFVRIRETVDAMQTLCHPSDIVEEGASRGKSGDVLIGSFLANASFWKGTEAGRLKDELRAIEAEQYWHDEPVENPGDSAADIREELKHRERKREKALKGAAVGTAVGGTAGAILGPVGAAIGAGAGGYLGAKAGERRAKRPKKNPRPFASRTHDWKEVLIQAEGRRVTRGQIRDYYWKNRKKIWPFLEGQTVLVVMAPRKNDFVLLRKRGSDDKYIKLTRLDGIDDEKSFEYWISRRVVEFHPVLAGKKTPILWLDIDIHATTGVKAAALRAAAKKAFPKMRGVMRQFGVSKIYSYDSGIGGYHLEGPLSAPRGVDKLRKDFTVALKEAFADDPTFTTGIAKSGQIRLDTTTMHTLGSLRAPYSFTVAGGAKKRI